VFWKGSENKRLALHPFNPNPRTATLKKKTLTTTQALGPSPRMDAATIGGMLASFATLFSLSLALGVAFGLGGAWLIKATRVHGGPPAIGLICTSAYTAYLAGDAAGLSGIVALFCAAVALAHYGLPSLTRTDRGAVRAAVAAASLVAEGAIFAFVGLAALDPAQWDRTHTPSALGLAALVLLLMLASRAAWLAPVLAAHNRWAGTSPLGAREGGVAWWAGAMRGAVSVALVCFYYAKDDDEGGEVGGSGEGGAATTMPDKAATLVSATLIVVLVSTLGFGAVTKPILERLLPPGSGGGEGRGGGVEAGGRPAAAIELAAAPPGVSPAPLPPAGLSAKSPLLAAQQQQAAVAGPLPPPPPPPLHPADGGSMEEVSLLGGGGGGGGEDGSSAAAQPPPPPLPPVATDAADGLVAAAWPAPPPRPPLPPPSHWRRSVSVPDLARGRPPVGHTATGSPASPRQQREFVEWWTAFDARVMQPVFSRPEEGGGGEGGGDGNKH
jgi:hypothetical protein